MEATDSSLEHNQYLVRNRYGKNELIDISSHNFDLTNLPARGKIDGAFKSLRAKIAAMDFCSIEARKEMLGSLDVARATAHREYSKVQTMTQMNVPVADLMVQVQRRKAEIENSIRHDDGVEPAR